MSAHIFWPDEQDLRQRGFERVAHVPCFFDGEWRYLRDPSTYVIERALLDWTPTAKGKRSASRMPTKLSLQAYAESLSNFLRVGRDSCEFTPKAT